MCLCLRAHYFFSAHTLPRMCAGLHWHRKGCHVTRTLQDASQEKQTIKSLNFKNWQITFRHRLHLLAWRRMKCWCTCLNLKSIFGKDRQIFLPYMDICALIIYEEHEGVFGLNTKHKLLVHVHVIKINANTNTRFYTSLLVPNVLHIPHNTICPKLFYVVSWKEFYVLFLDSW